MNDIYEINKKSKYTSTKSRNINLIQHLNVLFLSMGSQWFPYVPIVAVNPNRASMCFAQTLPGHDSWRLVFFRRVAIRLGPGRGTSMWGHSSDRVGLWCT